MLGEGGDPYSPIGWLHVCKQIRSWLAVEEGAEGQLKAESGLAEYVGVAFCDGLDGLQNFSAICNQASAFAASFVDGINFFAGKAEEEADDAGARHAVEVDHQVEVVSGVGSCEAEESFERSFGPFGVDAYNVEIGRSINEYGEEEYLRKYCESVGGISSRNGVERRNGESNVAYGR